MYARKGIEEQCPALSERRKNNQLAGILGWENMLSAKTLVCQQHQLLPEQPLPPVVASSAVAASCHASSSSSTVRALRIPVHATSTQGRAVPRAGRFVSGKWGALRAGFPPGATLGPTVPGKGVHRLIPPEGHIAATPPTGQPRSHASERANAHSSGGPCGPLGIASVLLGKLGVKVVRVVRLVEALDRSRSSDVADLLDAVHHHRR